MKSCILSLIVIFFTGCGVNLNRQNPQLWLEEIHASQKEIQVQGSQAVENKWLIESIKGWVHLLVQEEASAEQTWRSLLSSVQNDSREQTALCLSQLGLFSLKSDSSEHRTSEKKSVQSLFELCQHQSTSILALAWAISLEQIRKLSSKDAYDENEINQSWWSLNSQFIHAWKQRGKSSSFVGLNH